MLADACAAERRQTTFCGRQFEKPATNSGMIQSHDIFTIRAYALLGSSLCAVPLATSLLPMHLPYHSLDQRFLASWRRAFRCLIGQHPRMSSCRPVPGSGWSQVDAIGQADNRSLSGEGGELEF